MLIWILLGMAITIAVGFWLRHAIPRATIRAAADSGAEDELTTAQLQRRAIMRERLEGWSKFHRAHDEAVAAAMEAGPKKKERIGPLEAGGWGLQSWKPDLYDRHDEWWGFYGPSIPPELNKDGSVTVYPGWADEEMEHAFETREAAQAWLKAKKASA